MNGIGLDCGTATVKLAMLSQERELLWFKSSAHHGAAVQTVRANYCRRIAMLAAIQ